MVRGRLSGIARCLLATAAGALAFGGVGLLSSGTANAATDTAMENLSGWAISPSQAPVIAQGTSSGAGANLSFTMPNTFASGDTIVLQVQPHASANCATTNDFVGFAGIPTVSAVRTSGSNASDTTPSFATPVLASSGACTSATVEDKLTLSITNTATGTSTDVYTVTLSGITYDVGSAADFGTVDLAVSATPGTGSPTTQYFVLNPPNTTCTATCGTLSPPSNAVVGANASATGNNPAVVINSSLSATHSGSVSNISVTEGAAGVVTGSICITPNSSVSRPSFNFTGTPTASASSSGTAGTPGTPSISGGVVLVPITTASSGSGNATTYTISGLSVSDTNAVTGVATATVTTGGTTTTCGTTVISESLPVFDAAPLLDNAIAGQDADGTAIAELETAYPPSGNTCVANQTVIIATDQNFPDALAASYLASYLKTGILLTPTDNLSSETQAALQAEGVTNVEVVGGPLAVSQNTINQIEATPAYTCGGPAGGGHPTGGDIRVTGPIFGQTQYDTAEAIDTTPPSSFVGTADLSGAYSGAYNHTSGAESSAPSASGSLRTAIVATGANFPDAIAGSVLAYNNHFPIVLTDPSTLSSQASTVLQALGIQQVILLGGPLAVSDTVVSSIQALGISVIRVAGVDQTDTAQELASLELKSQTTDVGLGWSATWGNTILVARGDFYSDALAGCVLIAHYGGGVPLLETLNPSTVGQYLTGFLNAGGSAAGIDGLNATTPNSGNIQTIQPLGGPLALNATTLTTMANAVAAG